MKAIRYSLITTLWCVVICCWAASSSAVGSKRFVLAQDAIDTETAADGIEATIEERDAILDDPLKRSILGDRGREFRKVLKEWEKNLGFEITTSYDTLAQGYADPSDSLFGSAGELAVSGRWLIWGSKYIKPAYITFRVRYRHSITDYAPADFVSETDLITGTVDGFNDSGFQIPSLYINQTLFKDRLTLYYGQFSIDNYFDNHLYRSAKRYFLNKTFSSNPVVGFPSYGAGLVGHWQGGDRWSSTIGVSNVQGVEDGQNVDLDIDSSALFEALQGAMNFKGIRGKDARLQVMGWNSDSNGESGFQAGDGLSLTLEHEGFREGESIVLRYARAIDDSTSADTVLFVAYGKDMHRYDHFGVGLGADRSTETGDWQTVFEVYYKAQITKELIITPDIQVIAGDGIDSDNNLRIVAGIRMGITF